MTAAAPLGPADVVGMLRAAGVPYEVICVEPVVTMTAPDHEGWLSLVPRLDEHDVQRWYVLCHAVGRGEHWGESYGEDVIAAVDFLGGQFTRASPLPPTSPPRAGALSGPDVSTAPPERGPDPGGLPWWR